MFDVYLFGRSVDILLTEYEQMQRHLQRRMHVHLP